MVSAEMIYNQKQELLRIELKLLLIRLQATFRNMNREVC